MGAWSAGRRQRLGENPFAPLAIGAPHAPIRSGLRDPTRGAHVARRQVGETNRPDAAPPGAPSAKASYPASAPGTPRARSPAPRPGLPAEPTTS